MGHSLRGVPAPTLAPCAPGGWGRVATLGVIILCDSGRRIFKRSTRRVNRHMLQDAILQCETSTKFTREARPRRVGPKRRGRAHESRSRFVDMDDQWTFQCEIQKRHPLRDETSTDETTPKPDRPRPHLGRNRVLAYGPVTFPHSGV